MHPFNAFSTPFPTQNASISLSPHSLYYPKSLPSSSNHTIPFLKCHLDTHSPTKCTLSTPFRHHFQLKMPRFRFLLIRFTTQKPTFFLQSHDSILKMPSRHTLTDKMHPFNAFSTPFPTQNASISLSPHSLYYPKSLPSSSNHTIPFLKCHLDTHSPTKCTLSTPFRHHFQLKMPRFRFLLIRFTTPKAYLLPPITRFHS